MTVKVKICGITTPDALDAAAEAGADWVGYVFFPRSPRAVTPPQAAALDTHRRGPARVGLFVEPTDSDIAMTLAAIKLDVLQVHATTARAAEMRTRFGVPVWHVAGISSAADLPVAAPGIDGLLLDAKAPPSATRPGGNALSFDWSLLQGWAAPLPWLLAGGLTPGNVAEAVRVSGALAVDVSSGVERTRGVKDVGLIRAFVAAAKAAR